ncbi:MAG: Gfo/Idh/MocA family oxidoreductase [Bacteroidia bacterium]
MTHSFRWGILATGNIATKFALGLQTLSDTTIQAVGSRNLPSAQSFADQFNIPNVHSSYEALAKDPEVDAIYVANPHPYHLESTLLCLENGKPVLCEKPMAINYAETQQMVNKAREKGLFMMEAMWTRFMPAIVELRKLLDSGIIGEVKMLTADFGFYSDWEPEHRRYNPDLAGGALLDVGIYPLAFAYMIFKNDPVHVSSFADIGETGVDEQSAYLLGYKNGAIARLSSSVRHQTAKEAQIHGTKGMIHVPLFWRADQLTIQLHDQEPETRHFPYESSGLQFEAIEAMNCIRNGELESKIMPLSETLRLAKLMDDFRAEWGMKYPGE